MNIYEKLAHARVDLQEMGLRKSGRNNYSGYDYFELKDYLPAINKLMVKYNMVGICSFYEECATLSIVDAENPEDVVYFHSPMGHAALKGCHDVQNLGAVETYTRRYLYMAAFEIVEGDTLDAVQGSDEDPLGTGNTEKRLPSRGQAVCEECGAKMTGAQAKLSQAKFEGRLLCPNCQPKEGANA